MANIPWYKWAVRWGQTNITERDPQRYDIDWWREHWKRTRVQGVIINVGGIVAYYPSEFPLHHRAQFLADRDLVGELVAAARADGLAVIARMDSNRTYEPFFQAYPEWFARTSDQQPYRDGPFYITCIHSPYYETYIPEILTEIIERYHPDGFADNSWSGLRNNQICYCNTCRQAFPAASGMQLPVAADWEDPAYRAWIRWSYARRTQIWDINNATSQRVGGDDCLWIGMNSGDLVNQSGHLRDMQAITARSKFIFLDNQTRNNLDGFQANGNIGKLLHEMAGWDKLIPESMAMYQSPGPTFRVASKPAPEARMWMVEGFAGGIQPWWHHIGAYHEDRRQYTTAIGLTQWHAENETLLHNRQPLANVALVWSQQNVDFYGRDQVAERFQQPFRGAMHSLIRARIPYLPVHADAIPTDTSRFKVIILPNLGAMSDSQCDAVRAFRLAGGSVIASGETSLYDLDGQRRTDFALGDVFGAHHSGTHEGEHAALRPTWDAWAHHSYLRLHPELRSGVYGPHIPEEAGIDPSKPRHPILAGFAQTDILPFGGRLENVTAGDGTNIPLTFIPAFPIYPPETAWMRSDDSGKPACVVHDDNTGKSAYFAADVFQTYGRDLLPDHTNLIANAVQWALGGHRLISIDGNGLLDVHMYQQLGKLIVHLVNLSHPGTWRAPLHELLPVGPITIDIPLNVLQAKSVRIQTHVAHQDYEANTNQSGIRFAVPSVLDHELISISTLSE